MGRWVTRVPKAWGHGWGTRNMRGGAQLALGRKVSHPWEAQVHDLEPSPSCLGCQCCWAWCAWEAGCAALLKAMEKRKKRGLGGS